MFTLVILHAICFLSGVAVYHAYRDDKSLQHFAQALVTVATTPTTLAVLLFKHVKEAQLNEKNPN